MRVEYPRRTASAPERSTEALRVVLVALYSETYPAIGETHGLSAVAGAVANWFGPQLADVHVLDMVVRGTEDTQPILDLLAATDPHVLGVSVSYGTYDGLLGLQPTISRLLDEGRCVVLGGSLPTYLAARVLDEVDARLVIVVGEGEEATVGVIRAWLGEVRLPDVANLAFRDGAQLIETERQLAPVETLPPPWRGHIPEIIRAGAQIFAETSRACSWAACSFCLRGLTDVEGRPREFRRLPTARILHDLRQLAKLGAPAVTFADEDFLGGDLDDTATFIERLGEAAESESLRIPPFDISATIRSIFDASDDASAADRKVANLAGLKRLGLRKVFLGVESGSQTQLRRYRKGHTVEECVAAAQAIRDSGLHVELGFIMFDPLCSPREIAENVRFLLDNDLAQFASAPTSELRLQAGSRYLPILQLAEKELGRELYSRILDPNTLSYPYQYRDPAVEGLVAVVRDANTSSRPLVYRLKGLTRFGDGAILGPVTSTIRDALGAFRNETLRSLRVAAESGNPEGYQLGAKQARMQLAATFISATSPIGQPTQGMLSEAIDQAERCLREHAIAGVRPKGIE